MRKMETKAGAFSPVIIVSLILIGVSLFINPQTVRSEDIQFLSPQGESLGYSSIIGQQYTLLYIIKPWHGITFDVLKELQKTENNFYGRVKPVIVFTDTKRAVANAYMQKLNFKKTPYYIDTTFALTKKLNPFALPICLLLSSDGEEIVRTSSPGSNFLKQLSENPARYIKSLNEKRTKRVEPAKEIHQVHSPWGPPEVKINNSQTHDGHTSK